MNDPELAELIRRVRIESKPACKHLGPKAYAELLGVTVPRLKELQQAAGSTRVIMWKELSEPVLRAMFEAYINGSEVASRFCSRHGYPPSGFSNAMREMWPEEWAIESEGKRPEARNLYKMGRAFEGRTRLHLEAAGYFVVRSAGSKTKVDLMAAKEGQLLLIQCKRSGALPPDEWNQLLDIAELTHGIPILVENPHAGQVSWWKVLTRKAGRGTGLKEPFPVPPKLYTVDFTSMFDDEDEDDDDNDDPAAEASETPTETEAA
ncbi:hypothetical protein [Leucobacter sp. cx-169]|uniref:hypothetical protein n=1 Tax=Leucobacter sp. cx-169 TaxID=2770549 RepID=UPI00165DCF47|nr:hypothetical protein [Leucobacter sp. cx-169]MBC9927402.1 hypothetical protein [Leucobacter sp. cx-169]